MILLIGDNHGRFRHVLDAITFVRASGMGAISDVIFLGDIEAQRPFETEIAPILALGVEVHWIVGNHDTDSEENWRHLQGSMHRRLDGRVTEIAGLRIAGLGGVFRGQIWFPRDSKNAAAVEDPAFQSYDEFSADLGKKQGLKRRLSKMDRIQMEAIPDRIAKLMDPTKNGQLRKHCSTIFPDVVRSLSAQHADILLTHEAPGYHRHGFDELTRLAQAMGVRMAVHAHHHENLDHGTDPHGFAAFGVGFCDVAMLDPATLELTFLPPAVIEDGQIFEARNGPEGEGENG
ncbi:MAG: metallophosphoesterase [Rhodocyclaceae bacterium]